MGLLYSITAIITGIITAALITFIAIALMYSLEKLQARLASTEVECEECLDAICIC